MVSFGVSEWMGGRWMSVWVGFLVCEWGMGDGGVCGLVGG